MKKRFVVTTLGVLAWAGVACSDDSGPLLDAPQGLAYELEASGDPLAPAGILLFWTPVATADLEVYNIYSRAGQSDPWDLRGSTTSATFHDNGIPDLEYRVTAVDINGEESAPSNSIIVDERLRLDSPRLLSSISLDNAIQLLWDDNAARTAPNGFKQYRVYSASFSLDQNLCGDDWSLFGTTVSPDFLATVPLVNGVPRCFAVSAESVEGFESLWSDIIADTPRPDARNVLMFPFVVDPDRSGFRFFQDSNNDGIANALELGLVVRGDRTDIDFWVFRDPSGDVFLVPERAGVEVALVPGGPIEDLTSIDLAPETGYSTAAIQALPGFGYVFRIDEGDGFFRFGAVRVTHVATDELIFDWSYQTDPGNPELQVHGGRAVFEGKGLVVKRR